MTTILNPFDELELESMRARPRPPAGLPPAPRGSLPLLLVLVGASHLAIGLTVFMLVVVR